MAAVIMDDIERYRVLPVKKVVSVTTERLTLIPLTMQHLDSLCAYALDPENAALMVYLPKRDREEAAEFIRKAEAQWELPKPDFYEFAILRKGEHIGSATMYFEGDFTRGELGWIIRRDCWGNGYAAEAARGLMDHFAEKMKLKRFIAHCDSENHASHRVMEKLGMTYVETYGGRFNRTSNRERNEDLFEIVTDGGQ